MVTRREFLDTLAAGAAGLVVGSTAKSYGQILGSNDRLNFAVIGLNGRAYAHLSALKANKKDFEIHTYEDAGHSFFATDRPAYRVAAANDGWERVFEFFGRHLTGRS